MSDVVSPTASPAGREGLASVRFEPAAAATMSLVCEPIVYVKVKLPTPLPSASISADEEEEDDMLSSRTT